MAPCSGADQRMTFLREMALFASTMHACLEAFPVNEALCISTEILEDHKMKAMFLSRFC